MNSRGEAIVCSKCAGCAKKPSPTNKTLANIRLDGEYKLAVWYFRHTLSFEMTSVIELVGKLCEFRAIREGGVCGDLDLFTVVGVNRVNRLEMGKRGRISRVRCD